MDFDKDVSIPASAPRKSRSKYGFDLMEVGDSKFWPNATTARYSAHQWKHRHPGWRFEWRSEGTGVRIWRTA